MVNPSGLLATMQVDPFFEDNAVGRLKKEIWEANEPQIDAWLKEYGTPSPCEWTKPGSYIQTTVRHQVEANRRNNDVVLIPLGCTENHGKHMVSAADTLYVSMICEGVRRYTAKRGAPVNLALPPLMYGGHPYHHMGMPGTVILRESVVRELLIDVMLGLWNDGFRKQIFVNNHGHLWMLEAALQEFCKRYQLPGIYRVMDWHRAVREFFRTSDAGGEYETPFIHADESERNRCSSSPAGTSTPRWIPIGAPTAGAKARAISRSRSRAPLRGWSGRRRRGIPARPGAPWWRSCAT